MERKIKPTGLFFTALAVAALLLAPGVPQAQAARPFEEFVAQGPFVITLGAGIHPAGTSGRFVVPSRRVLGFLFGSVNAPFMIQFATNVPIATQSGNVHGTLYICENADPTLGILGCLDPSTVDFSDFPTGPNFLLSLDTASLNSNEVTRTGRVALKTSLGAGTDPLHPLLNVAGVFTFTGGETRGHGDVQGFLTLILDDEGHIVGLGASSVVLCGNWNELAALTPCPF